MELETLWKILLIVLTAANAVSMAGYVVGRFVRGHEAANESLESKCERLERQQRDDHESIRKFKEKVNVDLGHLDSSIARLEERSANLERWVSRLQDRIDERK